MLPIFTFSITEIQEESCLEQQKTRNIIEAFKLPMIPCNEGLVSIGDYNIINACPIIPIGDDNFILFQGYNLLESLYESPFYWMNSDRKYRNTSSKNRGNFTEEFAANRLKTVFGEKNTLLNVNIVEKKGKIAGEIDILVVFADRALIIQAKSKKLTLQSRKGNDGAIQNDFKKAVQDAYDQAFDCAKKISDNNYKLMDMTGNEIKLCRKFKQIFVCCLVSDHYPSLSFQARQFLKFDQTKIIQPPYVIDIFSLDVICEFLSSPLRFLDFLHHRISYHNQIISNNELAILAFHLKNNLSFEKKYTNIFIPDEHALDLDVAFSARRNNAPGETVPKGILTKYIDRPFGKLIDVISHIENSDILEFGFLCLSLNEETVKKLNEMIETITTQTRIDGNMHDFSMGIPEANAGITAHSVLTPSRLNKSNLIHHCQVRKYAHKANSWFGLAICTSSNKPFEYIIHNNEPWLRSSALDKIIDDLNMVKPA